MDIYVMIDDTKSFGVSIRLGCYNFIIIPNIIYYLLKKSNIWCY